jgi:KDO2-lipid IV(A) lauroyltransferase
VRDTETAVEERPEAERVTLREHAAYYAYAGVARIAAALPRRIGRPVFGVMGSLAFRALGGVRATVLANQAQVLGRPLDDPFVVANAREAFRRYAHYWYDTFAGARWSDEQLDAAFVWDGDEYLVEPTSRGQGVIAVLPHMGNWDVSGRSIAVHGMPIVAVAEYLRPERLFRLFVRQREALGIEIIALGQHAGIGKALAQAIDEGAIVALLADRDLTGRGIQVEMFGKTRRMPAGPAMLSLTTGAPIVVVGSVETAGGWRAQVRPLDMPEPTGDRRTDARAITQAIAEAFERMIASSPPDWHLFQPGWPPDAVQDRADA